MAAENPRPGILATLCEPRAHTQIRCAASLIAACAIAAIAVAMPVFVTGRLGLHFYSIDPSFAVMQIAAGGMVWLMALAWIWTPSGGRGRLARPIFSTIAVMLLAFLLTLCGEVVSTAGMLLACAIIISIWLRAYIIWTAGKPVHSAEGLVDLHCPHCRYSLIGLRDCRCPECGFDFTLDELVAAQGYGGTRQKAPAPIASETSTSGLEKDGHHQVAPAT